MFRTRLVLAAAVVGGAGLLTLSRGQDLPGNVPAPPGAPRAGVRAMMRQAGQPGPGFDVFFARAEDGDLHREINEGIEKLSKETDAGKKADLEKEVKAGLAKQFDARQEARGEELKNLEERIKQLREQFDKRQKAKNEIVESRFQELVRAQSGLGWGDEGHDGPHIQAYGFGGGAPGGLPYPPPATVAPRR